MDLVIEFLEKSTIHGLVYISSAPTKSWKAFWFLVVAAGFSAAIYLINDSYEDWQASPIATSTSIQPIADLDFPTITVCPPKGSNTALNYDLKRLKNISLTEAKRQRLISMITELLITQPSSEFVALARTFKSNESILELFKEKPQSTYPMPYFDISDKTFGYEVWSSQSNGSFHTPGFGNKISCNKTLQNVHFVLLLPKAIANNDILQIQVIKSKGWEVQYRQGSKYVWHNDMRERSSWKEAEKICREDKGHLASVNNVLEREQIGAGYMSKLTWIGGSDLIKEGVWAWTDGTPWPIGPTCDSTSKKRENWSQSCTGWGPDEPNGGSLSNCLSISTNYYRASYCDSKKDFICRFNPSALTANATLTIQKRTKGFSKIEFWLKGNAPFSSIPCNASRNMPGFSIKWGISNINSTNKGQRFGVEEVLKKLAFEDGILREARYDRLTMQVYDTYLSKNMRYEVIRLAKGRNMTNDELWYIVKRFKEGAIKRNLFTCEDDVMNTIYFTELLTSLKQLIIDANRPKISYRETDEDLLLAYDIFSYLIFCQDETMTMHTFLGNLISTASPATILLATINTMKLNHKQRITETSLQRLYDEMKLLMDLRLPDIVSTMTEHDIVSGNPRETNRPDQRLMARVSLHPPSIYDEQNISPSALIPFCSFGAKIMGSKAPNMTFPVCDIFEPTVFQGRLCYQADPKKSDGQQIFKGKKSGLMMMIDVNEERSFGVEPSAEVNDAFASYDLDLYLGENQHSGMNLASIFIGTLARHEALGSGDYMLTSIKEMTGTENFLAWPTHKRDCSLEKYENCQMRAFVEETIECGCSPFQHLPARGSTAEVYTMQKHHFKVLTPNLRCAHLLA